MEGERIFQQILQGDARQLQSLQNYIAPLRKVLDSNPANCVGKKAEEIEQIICKYGTYCQTLLRYCIEALSKAKKTSNGQDCQVREECFKCSDLGADMLSKLVSSGISLPSNLSISAMAKLLFHLIINALKEKRYTHLLHFTDCLINITNRALELGLDKESKDAISLCKQTSDHLWNAAIKLEQSNCMEKHKKAIMALSLRNNSLNLLMLAKNDLILFIERGLQAARQFQVGFGGPCESEDNLRDFLFALLSKAVALFEVGTTHNDSLKEGVYNLLEELCINCCKAAVDAAHCCELLELFSLLTKRDSKNHAQGRFCVTQNLIQMLQCALCLHLKRAKKIEKFNNDMKWCTLRKQLVDITEFLKHLDSNVFVGSQIIQVMDYLRFVCSKLLKSKQDDESNKKSEKIPDEMLSTLVNIFLVCFNVFGSVLKSKKQVSSQLSSWKTIVRPRLSILYLISSLVLKRSNEGLSKAVQNSRKVSVKFDYVSCVVEAKTIIDNVVEEVPDAAEHYRFIATDAFNVGLLFFQISQFNDATSLARLSCEAANMWCSKGDETDGIQEVLLCKKNEFLSDCLEKQGQWKESLCAMSRCCQLYALTTEGFVETGPSDNKALKYVGKWTTKKHCAIKQLGEGKDTHQIKKCSLYDGWEQQNVAVSDGKEICTLLKIELICSRKKGSCTIVQNIAIMEKLVEIFTKRGDHLDACLMKLEKVKALYQKSEKNTNIRQCLSICKEIIANLTVQQHQDSVMAKDILALSYFWCFVLQYSMAIEQSEERGASEDFRDETDDDEPLEVMQDFSKVSPMNLSPDFLLSLHTAVNIWTQMVDDMATSNGKLDVLPSSDICWNLQIASSVYGFLNMPHIRIQTLSVLVAVAHALGGDENLQTVVVAHSCAIHILCEEGNVQCAEMLVKRCEEILALLGKNCQPETSYVFRVAKSHLLLLREMYDDGWRLLNDVLNNINESKKPVLQSVLLKAKLLCSKYLSLPACISKIYDNYTHVEYLLNSFKHAEALVDYFVGKDGGDGITNLAGVSKEKEHYGILLSHWSVLSELSCCLMHIGKVFLLQGAVREGKKYLEDGRNIASKYSSPIRFSEFTLQLAELNFLKDDLKASETCLKQVSQIFRPDASLLETVDKAESFELPSEFTNSPFKKYDEISVFRLYVLFLVTFCQYLRIMGKPSDVKTVIALLHVLRQNSVERYQRSLASLQHSLEATCVERSCHDNNATLPSTSRGNTKTKAKRGKTATKLTKKKNSPVFPSEEPLVSSVFLIESGLKLHALESDVALSEGDYTKFLASVKEGLKLLELVQQFTINPFLLDLVSSSLLYYLRGVAHVLSSKCGFDSWRVAGSSSSPVPHGKDVEDMSVEISSLEISSTVECHVKVDKDDDSSEGNRSPSMEQMLREWEDLDSNNEKQRTVLDKMRKSERSSKCNAMKDVGAEKKSSKRTTTRTRKNLSKKNEVAEEKVRTSNDDVETRLSACSEMHAGKDSRNLRNGSRSTKKDDDVLTRSSTKTRQNVRNKKNPFTKTGDAESEKTQSEVSVVNEDRPPKRNRAAGKKKKSRTAKEHCGPNEADIPRQMHVEYKIEQDEEILKALECFHLSLEYLHPNYNPVLLTRVCHALVLCYGLTSPAKAALYQNLPVAVTLRHQAVHSSNKKIRKVKDEMKAEQIEGGNADDLVKLFDSMSLDNSNRVNLIKLLQLKTIKNAIGFKASSDEIQERFNHFMDLLPRDLTICTLSVLPSFERENVKYLFVSRLRKNKKPLVLKLTLPNDEDEKDEMEEEFRSGDSVVRDLSTIFRQNIFNDFSAILRKSARSMELKSKVDWWNTRRKIDVQLQKLVQRLERTWFGKWCGVLSGCVLEEENASELQSHLAELQIKALEIFGEPVENEQLLEVLIEGYPYLKSSEVTCALAELTGRQSNSTQVTKFCQALEQFFNENDHERNSRTVSRGPVVLILDKAIQHLPFESMPILRDQEVSRMPSLDFVASHLSLHQMEIPATVDILTTGVDTSKTFYVLNPKNDLQRSEKIFREWFSSEKGWSGVVGRPPSTVEFKEALSTHHLFLYIGHGTGREFLKGDEVQRLYCQAVAVLMGCSSGKLMVQGNCDASGMVLNYLLSGCPAVVANLWDVTDGDIDRFCDALLKKWLEKDNNLSLSQCVTQCRSMCKLKYLIGSSPVVYGMPVYTRTTKK